MRRWEDAPGQVVGVVNAGCVDSLGGLPQSPQESGGGVAGYLLQDVLGDGEYGPVVDFQNFGPRRQCFILRVGYAGAADQEQGFYAIVHPRDALVKDHSVGDDGAGHPAGLRNVAHPKQPGDGGGDVGPQFRHVV